jgi:hypothetical protein
MKQGGAEQLSRAGPLGLRVAMSGCEVSVEDGGGLGDAVIEVARRFGICARIVVSDAAGHMAGWLGDHSLTSVRATALRGVAEALEV